MYYSVFCDRKTNSSFVLLGPLADVAVEHSSARLFGFYFRHSQLYCYPDTVTIDASIKIKLYIKVLGSLSRVVVRE